MINDVPLTALRIAGLFLELVSLGSAAFDPAVAVALGDRRFLLALRAPIGVRTNSVIESVRELTRITELRKGIV